jgi:3-phenylpropionate/cinnamic acid dioxygenase small subunit
MVSTQGTLQAVADELAIRNIVARLAQLADSSDLDEYIALFDENASWEILGAAPRRGRAAILAGAKERRATGRQGPGTNSRHVITTLAVQVDGDTATASAYFLFVADTNKVPVIRAVARYDDAFRRTAEGWKLARRVITFG